MNELPTAEAHLVGVRALVAHDGVQNVGWLPFCLPGPSLTRGGCYLRRGCFLMGAGIAHHLAHHLPALVLMLMDSARSSLFKAMVASFAACLNQMKLNLIMIKTMLFSSPDNCDYQTREPCSPKKI